MRFSNILLMIDSNACNQAAWQRALALGGSESNMRVVTDLPDSDVPRLVRRYKHDLVIKSAKASDESQSRSSWRSDIDLMRSCPCPLMLVKPQSQSQTGGVLAALDLPSEDPRIAKLNERILGLAESIALAEFQQLHVVHAWHFIGEAMLRSRSNSATIAQVDRMVGEQELKRRDWLYNTVYRSSSDSRRLVTDYLSPELHVIKGAARSVVPDLANKLGVQLIVVGTAARKGVAGFVTGNTSEKILSQSKSSVLVVPSEPTLKVVSRASAIEELVASAESSGRNVLSADRRSSLRRRDRVSAQYHKATI
ncbi:MAG: universal stress protein [Pseudomonadales bacterium]